MGDITLVKAISEKFDKQGIDIIKGYSLITYIALKMTVPSNNTEQFISLDSLAYQLTENLDATQNKSLKNRLQTGLKELNEKGFITIKATNRNGLLIDTNNLLYIKYDELYEQIDCQAIRNIYKLGKSNVIIFLFRFLNELTKNNLFYFYDSRENLSKMFDIDIKTFDKYIKILEDNDVLYIYRCQNKLSNGFKSPKSIYGYNNEKTIEIINKNAIRYIK